MTHHSYIFKRYSGSPVLPETLWLRSDEPLERLDEPGYARVESCLTEPSIARQDLLFDPANPEETGNPTGAGAASVREITDVLVRLDNHGHPNTFFTTKPLGEVSAPPGHQTLDIIDINSPANEVTLTRLTSAGQFTLSKIEPKTDISHWQRIITDAGTELTVRSPQPIAVETAHYGPAPEYGVYAM